MTDSTGTGVEADQLRLFVRESNWIEGIRRDPTEAEIVAHADFLAAPEVTLDLLVSFVDAVQPGAKLRDRSGLNVYVGDHVPPAGGYGIPLALHDILERATDPYQTHAEYETLHPFTDGNGRSGRVLWLRMMGGQAPLGFLHHWYYQSLAGNGYRGKADTLPTPPQPDADALREAVLGELRGRKLLKYLFSPDPDDAAAYGWLTKPIDLETQHEIADALVAAALKDTTHG